MKFNNLIKNSKIKLTKPVLNQAAFFKFVLHSVVFINECVKTTQEKQNLK